MTANEWAPNPPQFQLSRWLFLRLVGFTYLLAFASLTPQILGLVGADGLLPIEELLNRAEEFFGVGAYYELPTLAWISSTDSALLAYCWVGIVTAVFAILGLAPIGAFALLWVLYLSLTVAGQTFLSFQWDVLLLEVGLLACFYAPFGLRPSLAGGTSPPISIRWLLWALAFKLTFLSGVTKLVSGDPTWSGLTAMTFHYQTQPLPAWTSWYAHNAPIWIHTSSAACMFLIELVVPFFALAPSRWRRTRATACALMCVLQIGIAATGNYGFFNLLAVVLYLALLDDAAVSRALPTTLIKRLDSENSTPEPRVWRTVLPFVTLVIAFFSTLTMWHEITYRHPHPEWSNQVLRLVRPARSINGYGLFRSMTTVRPELVLEVSLDGTMWREHEFRWKPGDLHRRPTFVQPHMPRLDWQMWFAALDPAGNEHWLRVLITKILKGSPSVVRLVGENPFGGERPRYARLAIYRYDFTPPDNRTMTGNWWHRQLMGYLTESVSLGP